MCDVDVCHLTFLTLTFDADGLTTDLVYPWRIPKFLCCALLVIDGVDMLIDKLIMD